MPDGFEPTRRAFLIGLTALVAVRIAPARSTPPATEISQYLEHFFPEHLATAIAVGDRYLEMVPSERSKASLAASVFGNSTPERAGNIRALTDHVRDLRRRDFQSGDLVSIDGWMLARTEVRLCALAAITAGG